MKKLYNLGALKCHTNIPQTKPRHREEESKNNNNDVTFRTHSETSTVLPAKSDSDVMFCLQGYQGLRIDRSPVY